MTSDDDKLISPVAQTVDAGPGDTAAAVQDPLVGKTLGHYRIVGRLGQGGMGVVYRAEDEKLRRVVALKVLADASGNEERRQRFLREARSAAAIAHPNVAVVHAVDEADGRIYIAMELVKGENLRQRMLRGRLDLATAKELAVQVARGLAAAHEQGIVHRDLKPENVMITPAAQVKLLDFGLAKVGVDKPASGKTEAALARTETLVTSEEGRIMGTPEYMSPEQALGEPLDVRSDVFSLGIVMYEMLTGTRPFGGTTTGAILVAIARDVAPPVRERAQEVDEATEAAVMKCLAKAPGERFASANEVVTALSGEKSPSQSTPSQDPAAVTPSVATQRPAGAAGNRIAVALAVVAALAAGGWWGLARRGRAPAPEATASASPAASADTAMSRSSNPEAQRLFEQAMKSFHDGTGHARELFERAVQTDASFGGAYVRLIILAAVSTQKLTPEEGKKLDEYTRTCRLLTSTLSARDRAAFSVFDQPKEGLTSEKRSRLLDEYLARYPDDAMMRLAAFEVMALSGNLPAIPDGALAADPTLVPALAWKAEALMLAHNDAEAQAVLDGCLELSPEAVDCLQARIELLSERGKCGEATPVVRRWLELQPDSREAHEALAQMLAAQGGAIEAVQQALGDTQGAGGQMLDVVSVVRGAHLPLFAGDFPAAVGVAKQQAALMKASLDETDYFLPAITQVLADNEMGDVSSAGHVAMDYLARSPAFATHDPSHEAFMVAAAARAGRMAPAAGAARIAAAYQKIIDDLASPPLAWLYAYAWGTETPREAARALVVYDQLHAALPPDMKAASSRTLFLGGRAAEARPVLEELAAGCYLALAHPQNWLRSHLYLGEIDEQAGDKASACGHYAKVLERWGHAKPRSVTADEARARATKLGCTL